MPGVVAKEGHQGIMVLLSCRVFDGVGSQCRRNLSKICHVSDEHDECRLPASVLYFISTNDRPKSPVTLAVTTKHGYLYSTTSNN